MELQVLQHVVGLIKTLLPPSKSNAKFPILILCREGDWVQVFGTFKNLGSTKSVNVSALKRITDYNQVTFHFLETIAANLACSDPSFLVLC